MNVISRVVFQFSEPTSPKKISGPGNILTQKYLHWNMPPDSFTCDVTHAYVTRQNLVGAYTNHQYTQTTHTHTHTHTYTASPKNASEPEKCSLIFKNKHTTPFFPTRSCCAWRGITKKHTARVQLYMREPTGPIQTNRPTTSHELTSAHAAIDWTRATCYGVATISRLLKKKVSFAEYSLFNRVLLQKRPIILRSLLIVATPYDCWISRVFACAILKLRSPPLTRPATTPRAARIVARTCSNLCSRGECFERYLLFPSWRQRLVCLYIFVYMYVYESIYMCVCVCVCERESASMFKYICICVCMYC